MKFDTFHYSSAEQMLEQARENGLEIPYQEDTAILASPVRLNGRTIVNRIMAQPIEGFDALPDGAPSDRTIRRYCALARGGSGSLWMESVSVNLEGRSNPHQLWITKENVAKFREMADAIRASVDTPVYLVLQLTHSGRNSRPGDTPAPVCAFHSQAIPKENERIITDEELEALEDDYVSAILLAEEAGFDAADIRACHGYLINELFAAVDRPGRYGGSFENRIRLLMNIVVKAQKAVSKIELGVRLNMYDGIPYPDGWGVCKDEPRVMDLSEPLELVRRLYDQGIRLLNISSGVGAYSPYVIRPYDRGGVPSPEHPLEGVARLQHCARLAKQAAPDAVVIVSGLTWLRSFGAGVAAGGIAQGWYDLAGYGRLSIADPNYANNILNGCQEQTNWCSTCCGCTTLIKKSGKMLRCIMRKEEQI